MVMNFMFSERLKSLRIEKDLLQKDISNILNISTSAYGFYEQNKNDEIISKVPKKFIDLAAGTDGNGNVQIKKIAYV